jgi:hypothetical protein
MSIIAKAESGSNFHPVPEGVHPARCFAVIDIGEQYSEKFDKKAQKIIIMWELPEETYTNDDGEAIPRVLSKEYTLSLHEKSGLRKDLQAWRGKAFTEEELKGFDLINILGKPCQIQIIHEVKGDKTYSRIAAIMAIPKGMKVADQVNERIYFDLSSGDLTQMAGLPVWIQDRIQASETYKNMVSEVDGNLSAESDLPF